MLYFDKTTNQYFTIPDYCEITKTTFNLTPHHYIKQQDCKNRKEWFKLQGIDINEKQRVFTLNIDVHSDVHHLTDAQFYDKYGRNRKDYLFSIKEYKYPKYILLLS